MQAGMAISANTAVMAARTVLVTIDADQKLTTNTRTAGIRKRQASFVRTASNPTVSSNCVRAARSVGSTTAIATHVAAETKSLTNHCRRAEIGRVRCHAVVPSDLTLPITARRQW